MINQQLSRLKQLAPAIQTAATELILRCERDLKYKLLVVRTWSSHAEQMELYKKGRMLAPDGRWIVENEKLIVTKSLPGQSAHNVVTAGTSFPAAMAVDLIPLNTDGTALWGIGDDFWDKLYKLSWRCGLDPLGDEVGAFLPFDKGHFEEPAWKLKLESWTDYRLP